MKILLDDWQKEVLKTEGNLVLRSGRQVGKSEIVSRKCAEYAVRNPKKIVMVISAVERQSYLLFEKILSQVVQKYPSLIMKGKNRPTKHKLQLKNGSIIYSFPTGLSGIGIRGYTVDLLIADEAAYIPEDVWTAVIPMLAMTGGNLWLLSTPKGKRGYFYECFKDDSFTKFHVTTEEVLNFETRTERQKEDLKKRLEIDKKRMTKLQYTQEYLGEFVDEIKQVFSDELIRKCCILNREIAKKYNFSGFYIGCDIAGLGGDQITYEILGVTQSREIIQIDSIIRKKQLTTETSKDIINLDENYNFKKIGIDDGGLGFGVWSELIENERTKRKTIALNNASREADRHGETSKKLLKEEMYINLLSLMEKGKIKLLDDDEIIYSLKSIQYEYSSEKRTASQLKIYGDSSHIAEGLIRAAWLCKNKDLNIFIHTF